MLDILLVTLYVAYGLGGLYTILVVTRPGRNEWSYDFGPFLFLIALLFIIALWPPLLFLYVRYNNATK